MYFFKHKGINGIKIGKTSGSGVSERFKSFKTYSPNGAEILGYFETNDGLRTESEIHKTYSNRRMSGEFFDITEHDVDKIINVYSISNTKMKNDFLKWVSSLDSNIKNEVSNLMKLSLAEKENDNDNEIYYTMEPIIIKDNLVPSELNEGEFLTTTAIIQRLSERGTNTKGIYMKRFGQYLKKFGFERKKKNGLYGYFVKFT